MSGITFASINLGQRGLYGSNARKDWNENKNNAIAAALQICAQNNNIDNIKSEVNKIATDLQYAINNNDLNEKHINGCLKTLKEIGLPVESAAPLLTNILTMARHARINGTAPLGKTNYFWYKFTKYNGANPTQSIKDFINSDISQYANKSASVNKNNIKINTIAQGLIYSYVGKIYSNNEKLKQGFTQIKDSLNDDSYIDDKVFICKNYFSNLDSNVDMLKEIAKTPALPKIKKQLGSLDLIRDHILYKQKFLIPHRDGAINKFGYCYQHGIGVTKNEATAIKCYAKAAELGNADAMYNLGHCYQHGIGVTKNEATAFAWYTKAAELGHADAMYNLGHCYQHGIGVTKNEATAVEWYTQAAELGHADSRYNLGNCYQQGIGATKNEATAFAWYTKAAELGHADATNNLGYYHEHGIIMAKNEATAVKWYIKAAGLGSDNAMYNLGSLYEHGVGVAKDAATAVKWYKKSAELGNDDAIYKLGRCYQNGVWVVENAATAIERYTTAAELGNDKAKLSLGHCYEDGIGVVKDLVKAAKWYNEGKDSENFERILIKSIKQNDVNKEKILSLFSISYKNIPQQAQQCCKGEDMIYKNTLEAEDKVVLLVHKATGKVNCVITVNTLSEMITKSSGEPQLNPMSREHLLFYTAAS